MLTPSTDYFRFTFIIEFIFHVLCPSYHMHLFFLLCNTSFSLFRIFWRSKKFEGSLSSAEPWYNTPYSVENVTPVIQVHLFKSPIFLYSILFHLTCWFSLLDSNGLKKLLLGNSISENLISSYQRICLLKKCMKRSVLQYLNANIIVLFYSNMQDNYLRTHIHMNCWDLV